MNKIEVAVLHEAHDNPAGMMMFLAKLTQRGHSIQCMDDLKKMYNDTMEHHPGAERVVQLPHSTIKRFAPITVAIVGASRRFLAQARTHQVGVNYVSASLQYSDYSGVGQFVVPYAITKKDREDCQEAHNLGFEPVPDIYRDLYLQTCMDALATYEELAKATDNDTAGYAMPQGLRNILVIQANHEAWQHFIRLRTCNRNTNETQYTMLLIWEALLKTAEGEEMFKFAGPDCVYGQCREGKMSCGKPMNSPVPPSKLDNMNVSSYPDYLIKERWPLLRGN